jgi:Arc/MetJ-type ribon-helix-helix transcriptional regulator
LTEIHVRDIPGKVGRKKLWSENINLTLPEGAKARMDAALEEGEDRLDLIRAAIEKELKRRERKGA